MLGLLPFSGLHAQTFDPQRAYNQALEVRAQWAGPDYPTADLRLSSAYADANGLAHVYVQQLFRGIPVYNKMQSLAFKSGRLAHHAGSFVPAKLLAALPGTPAISAAAAVSRTLQHLDRPFAVAPARLTEANGPEARQTFAPGTAARRDIVASLTWAFDAADRPHLAWNVNIDLQGSADWWNVRVDAATGAILGQDNWTVNEKAPHAETSAAGAATASAAAVAKAARLLPPPTTSTASFLVLPYPAENPRSAFQTETDPWLKAGATNNATTHGWNFDGTTNYSFTRGNNVSAYDDAANTNMPGNYATSQTASPSLTFAFPTNLTQPPTTVSNRNGAVTNLFYWNNIIHDLTYQYGFTEAAGNFQADNLSRGGNGNDFVRAEAQDGNGVNNANFSTPPDGTSGRMQMYLWNRPQPAYTFQVTAPSSIARSYTAVEGILSVNNRLSDVGPISGELALYTDANTNPATSFACAAHSGAALTGTIAVLYRGSTCTSAAKIKNAQLAGAIAVVVVNNVAGAPATMTGNDNTITIPSVMVSQADGVALVGQLASGVQVTLPRASPLVPQLDGDLDNGIIVHEYGHGVSTRLTGGPANSSCLNNAEQGGEGWSDYLGLMFTTDWATAQLGDGATPRPIGTYAANQPATGRGIRSHPYSTSLSINPLTYANVANGPSPHANGTVWCTALWDMTWAIIQQRGRIEPNLYNGAANGGNNIALQLVMQGMKLQPCQPGFLDARNAILAADSLLYQGQYQCTIWRSFARRGMGYSAVQGSSGNASDQTAAYDMPPPVTLAKVSSFAAGNTFSNEYKLTCNCEVPTTPYTLTNELPTGLQFVSSSTGGTLVGNKVTFSNLNFTAPGQSMFLRFQAQASPGATCPTVLPVNDNREGNTLGGFTTQALTGTTNWAPSTARAFSGTTSWQAPAPTTPTEFVLTSAPFTPVGLSVLSFYQYFNFEGSYDGGRVEISADNGATWQNPSSLWIQNGYNGTFTAGTSAPGQACFSGSSVVGAPRFIRSVLDLRSFAGTPLLVRFHTSTDTGSPGNFEGWFVDDIQVINGCGGNQVVELRNSANALQGNQTVVTYLLPANLSAQKAGLAQASEFTAQPNPFGSQGLQLRLDLPAAQSNVAISLYDVAGRQLLSRAVDRVAAGASTLTWTEAARLPAGLYLVRIQLPDGSSAMLRVQRE